MKIFRIAKLFVFNLFICIMTVFVVSAEPLTVSYPDDVVRIEIEGQEVIFKDQTPIVLIPVRGVFEQLGYNVSWNNDTQTATLSNDFYTVTIKIGEKIFNTNGKIYNLDVPALIVNGRTMLPFREILESVNCKVEWDNNKSSVAVTYLGANNVTNTPTPVPTPVPTPTPTPVPTPTPTPVPTPTPTPVPTPTPTPTDLPRTTTDGYLMPTPELLEGTWVANNNNKFMIFNFGKDSIVYGSNLTGEFINFGGMYTISDDIINAYFFTAIDAEGKQMPWTGNSDTIESFYMKFSKDGNVLYVSFDGINYAPFYRDTTNNSSNNTTTTDGYLMPTPELLEGTWVANNNNKFMIFNFGKDSIVYGSNLTGEFINFGGMYTISDDIINAYFFIAIDAEGKQMPWTGNSDTIESFYMKFSKDGNVLYVSFDGINYAPFYRDTTNNS